MLSSRIDPMNCRMTPTPPVRATPPDAGARSPAIIFSRVVLPVPLAPTSAVLAPSPTRKLTSSNSTRPSGSTQDSFWTSTYPMPPVSPSLSNEIRTSGAGPLPLDAARWTARETSVSTDVRRAGCG